MSAPTISTRQHSAVRRFRQIATRRTDDEILLDGEHLLEDAVTAGVKVEVVLTTDPSLEAVRRAARAGADVLKVSASVLDAASPVRTPTGVVAIARWRPASIDVVLESATPAIALVDVQDPGNLGAVIRCADALGGRPVLALGQSADPAGWKALRGAMGSTFRVPVARAATGDAVALARARGVEIVATVAAGGTPPATLQWDIPRLVLLGGEGAGLAPSLVDTADVRVTVPMREGVDSLNVAATAAVVLYEAWRQDG